MPFLVIVLVLLSCCVVSSDPSRDPPPSCTGVPNTIPVHTAAPILIAEVPNGKLYLGGNGTDAFYVQHLFGSYHDMGFAHGQFFKDIITVGLNRFYDWVEQQVEDSAPWLPAIVAALIADVGVPIALEITFNDTLPFLPLKYYDEMSGIADGAGVSKQSIFNINMIAELIKAQCSIIGASGPATQTSLNGSLVHLRTLDGMGGPTMPIKDYAVVTVYHPDATLKEPAVANFGWVSFVGCVTGFGQYVGVGEKYWNGQNDTVMSTKGEAWTFVTRDVLSSTSHDEALRILQDANRTCAIHLGIGGRGTNQFSGVEVAAKAFKLFSPTSIDYPQHPIIPGIVYWDKYSQPTTSFCFADYLSKVSGVITAELLALHVAPSAETGDLHAAIFDYENQVAYFSNARKSNCTDGSIFAYNRQFTRLDMKALFNEQQQQKK